MGGAPTPAGFDLVTQKQKYLDGVAQSGVIPVSYNLSAHPDWIYSENGLKATENLNTQERYGSVTFTQAESGKSIDGAVSQAAASQRFEYTFSSKYPGINFNALGGISSANKILDITSTRQEYRNNHTYGNLVQISFTNTGLPSWLINTNESWSAQENKSLSSRSHSMTYTQNESGKKFTVTFNQAAGTQTYGDITINPTSGIADIPAAGGTSGVFTYSYSQPWGWNGKTNDGGTITSGATVNWSNAISGSNLGTTQKARTRLGSRTLTLSQNGKSASKSVDVYQAANQIVNVTQGAWVVSISANPSTFTEQGGTSQISASARASRTNHWSSGATSAASDATGTPTLSIPTASTGFSLSGTTLTVAENTTANQRSVVVRATMDTVYKEVTVTQSAYLVEWRYTFTASPTTLNFDALGTAKSITITSYREKYINGSLVEGSRENVSYIHATSTEHIGTVLGTSISMQENQTTSTRDGKVSYEQNGSNKVIQITCNQAAGTVAIREELVIKESFPTAPNIGGTVKALVRSGYWDVVNGKDTTWHDDTPTVKTKPSFVSSTSVTYELGVGYRISATMPENTSESQLSGSLNLEYGSKTLSLGVKQAGASVAWSYELKVNNGTQDLNQQVPAKPSGTYSFTISSKRYKIVNGSVTSQSEDTTWTTSIPGSPSWIHVEEQSNTLIVTVDENTTTSQRSADIVIFQTGSSDTSITLTVEQQAASITWNYTFNIFQPSSKVLNVPAKMIDPDTIVVNSYRTKVINGTQTSTKEFVEVTIDTPEENWLEVTKNSNDMTQAEFSVTCLENKVSSIRSATVTLRQVGSNKLDQVDINQSAVTISTRYEVFWNAVKFDGPAGERVTEVEMEGYVNTHESSVRLDLIALEYTTINGVEGTPVSLNTRPVGNNNSVEVVPNGGDQLFVVVVNNVTDIDCTYIGILNAKSNLNEYPRTHTVTLTNPKVVLNGKEIGQAPSVTIMVNPIPYTRVFEFSWKQEGSTITNITLDGDIYGSSAGSRDIISYVSLRRDGVEFTKKYVKPTFIPPSEDWLQVIDNGQNSDNSYNWAFRALTNNEGDSARNLQVRFEQPGNDNQALYAYVSQDPMATE